MPAKITVFYVGGQRDPLTIPGYSFYCPGLGPKRRGHLIISFCSLNVPQEKPGKGKYNQKENEDTYQYSDYIIRF